MPWGAKKQSAETNLPEVSAILCLAVSLTHSCIQEQKIKAVIVPATTLSENVVESKPDEVRWSVTVLGSL